MARARPRAETVMPDRVAYGHRRAGTGTRKRVASPSAHAPSVGRQAAGVSSVDGRPMASTSFPMIHSGVRVVPLKLRECCEGDLRPFRPVLQLVAQLARSPVSDKEIEERGDVL